ncbi:MAG: SAM-dependent methyltransferase [Nevskiales bacterium]|nr:SAM-dependent methyltransferase [Nevskiales bacterium]
MTEPDYLGINRAAWDHRTEIHVDSAFYDVPGFLAGGCSLRDIELAQLGDVTGQRLLHLQCHFGLDTLSWARRGARCTGVDLSPRAIEQARRLARQTGLAADFVCSDVYAFEASAPASFDIVFTSYGAICWLPDLSRWAAKVVQQLAPGGRFHMVEFHPVYDLVAGYGYFHRDAPDIETEGTYTDGGDRAAAQTKLATWVHPLGDVVQALIDAGLRIDSLREYPYSPYNCFDGLEEREPGRYFMQQAGHDLPLTYAIAGTRLDG